MVSAILGLLVLLTCNCAISQEVPAVQNDISLVTRAELMRMFDECSPGLKPAQQRSFELMTWPRRIVFLHEICKIPSEALPDFIAKSPVIKIENPAKSPVIKIGIPRVAVGQITSDTVLSAADMIYLRMQIVEAVDAMAGNRFETIHIDFSAEEFCDSPCVLSRASDAGAVYVISGEVVSFAGAFILKLEMVTSVGGAVVTSVETQAVDGAANLLSGVRVAVLDLFQSSPIAPPVARPVPQPAASTGHAQIAPAAAGPGAATSYRQLQEKHKSMPVVRKSYSELRIAAHLFLWVGLGGVVVGVIDVSMGNEEEMGAFYAIAGCVSMVTGMILGLVYRGKRRADDKMLQISPLLSPRFAGLGIVHAF